MDNFLKAINTVLVWVVGEKRAKEERRVNTLKLKKTKRKTTRRKSPKK